MIKVANTFCCNKHFVPRGYLPLPQGYIHVLNIVIFKCLLLRNSLTNCHQISHWAFCPRGIINLLKRFCIIACPYMVKKKHLQISSRTNKASRLNLSIQHWGLKVYEVDLNDDSRLTFDLSMARSNLYYHTLVWGKCCKIIF